jgi:hypothetical protein
MKKILCIILVFAIISPLIYAQETVVVKPGTPAKQYFKPDEIYKYPAFTYGKIIFKSSKLDSALMNYNILLSEMHFIRPPHDTLAIANQSDILYVIFKTDTFYCNNGYLQFKAQNSRLKLAQKQYVKILAIRKSSGYGMTSSTSAITSVTSFEGAFSTNFNLLMNDEMVLAKQIDYYFSISLNEFQLFNKGNILKVFSKEKVQIKGFMKANRIDFKKKEDIYKLVDFIGTLK